ncbi:MAG: hypothetical protein ACU0AT_10245 [Tranquillimonas sp.]
MTMPGHNGGPSMEPGQSWRRHCWGQARAELLPQLPLNVIRRRVARAKEIGLDCRLYAGVRAATGRDIVGFLFSSNALRVHPEKMDLPADRAAHLSEMRGCRRIALLQPPLSPPLPDGLPLDRADPAPLPFAPFGVVRQRVLAPLAAERLPSDAVLLIGDTALEREWAAAGRLAGYLPEGRFFGGSAGAR